MKIDRRKLAGLAIFGFCPFVLLTWSVLCHSAVVDEPGTFAAGYEHWRSGNFSWGVVNPPFVRLWATLPISVSPSEERSPVTLPPPHISRIENVAGRLWRKNHSGFLRLLRIAREWNLVFFFVATVVILLWSRETYGKQAAPVAAALWTFSPMALGHGSVLSADVGAAAMGLLAMFRLRQWLCRSDLCNASLLGLTAAAALSSKFTWCLVLPVSAAAAWLVWRGRDIVQPRVLRRDLFHISVATLIAILGINALYGFSGTFTRLGDIQFVNSLLKSRSAAGSVVSEPNVFTGTLAGGIPVPLPVDYLTGIDVQAADLEGHRNPHSYLLGEWKVGGWWYYYVVALLVKEPIPALLLSSMSLVMCVWPCARRRHLARCRIPGSPAGTDPRTAVRNSPAEPAGGPVAGVAFRAVSFREQFLVLVPALVTLVTVSFATGFNRHLRYLLPAYPFAYVFASQIAARQITARPSGSRWLTGTVWLLLVWQVAGTLWYAPHWVSWFNEAAGGPANGHRWLLGSNVDIGQDVLFLKSWMAARPEISRLFVELTGPNDAESLEFPATAAPPFVAGSLHVTDALGRRGPLPGWYAIGVNKRLQHLPGEITTGRPGVRDAFSYLDHFQPVDHVGYTIDIYRISDDEADRVRSKLEADEEVRFPETARRKRKETRVETDHPDSVPE